MQSEIPSCQRCRREFSLSNIPMLLPDCGHTICIECLKLLLDSNQSVKCNEDGVQVQNRYQISDFPQNFALVQLIKAKIQRRKTISFSGIPKFTPKFAEDYKNPPINEYGYSSNSENNNNVSYQTIPAKQRSDSSSKNFYPKTLSDDQRQESENSESKSQTSSPAFQYIERCQMHKKKLEIVCITDKVKICSTCALFGEHRNHEVLPIEDVVNKIQNKVNEMYVMLNMIEQRQLEIIDERQYEMIQVELQKNLVNSVNQVNMIFSVRRK